MGSDHHPLLVEHRKRRLSDGRVGRYCGLVASLDSALGTEAGVMHT
jgi:hypothetical protein